MNKKIKDYLHLYYGANCYYQVVGKADILYSKIDSYIIDNFSEWLFVKPELRPLSSMTEEEKKELGYIDDAMKWIDVIVNDVKQVYRITPERVHWLLSNQFDLFGLIESGLAIDKSKQPTQ